ncbi:hypothetical protein B0H14DRAFT_2614443 [Mycena olivaceomarginata]|nr:hypothetical protein B0H14DRAFT_2614443 [Mycena olivaceomarginata]
MHVVYDTVRAARAEPGKMTAKGIMPAKEGQFDTVLVRKDTPDPDHHPIHGISVARIRVIFRLPEHYGSYPHPLAYVDWYKPLKTPVPNIRMHKVSLSSRNHRQHSSIIPITEILRFATSYLLWQVWLRSSVEPSRYFLFKVTAVASYCSSSYGYQRYYSYRTTHKDEESYYGHYISDDSLSDDGESHYSLAATLQLKKYRRTAVSAQMWGRRP